MKKVNRIFLFILALFIIFPSGSYAKKKNISIVINGTKIQTDVAPYIKNGRTMVPVRFIVESLGGEASEEILDWYPPKYQKAIVLSAKAPLDDTALELHINERVCVESENVYRMDAAPEIKNGRTMVPLRFIADYLNYNVRWDKKTNTVIMHSSSSNSNKFYNRYKYDKGIYYMNKYLEGGSTQDLVNMFN